MKKKIEKLLLSPNAPIRDAFAILSETGRQIVFTIDEQRRVTGCVTDGDIRRALLRGATLDTPVEKAARKTFTSARLGTTHARLRGIMQTTGVRQIPVLDKEGRLTEVVLLDEIMSPALKKEFDSASMAGVPVVIMAGGKGSRLGSLTEAVPKPLLKVGDRALIERIVMDLKEQGASEFYVTVNYLAEQIIEYLGDGGRFGCKIEYVREDRPLGTAGSLYLLKDKLDKDFLVINGDVLSTLDVDMLSRFHREHRPAATVCTKVFTVNIPFGVVRSEKSDVRGIEEKPDVSLMVNSGIYLLSPRVLGDIAKDQALDMPTLLSNLIARGEPVKCFESSEPWIDIGSLSDFDKAKKNLEHLTR